MAVVAQAVAADPVAAAVDRGNLSRTMRSAIFVTLLFAIQPAAARGQTRPAADVAVGATIARDSVPATLAGVLLSASRPTSDRLGLVIEAGRHSGTESATLLTFPVQGLRYHYTETSAAAGLRYLVSPDPQGMVPFVQLQLGINRRHSSGAVTSATTSLVVQPELGIDFGISKAFALRAQAGWRYLMTDARYRNEIRGALSAVIRLGK